jgi:hypothetical protein
MGVDRWPSLTAAEQIIKRFEVDGFEFVVADAVRVYNSSHKWSQLCRRSRQNFPSGCASPL